MKALVTGGGGFLGLAIVRLLTKHGFSVRSLARNHYSALEDLGVVQLQGNLVDQAAVLSATEGCDLVFHVAAKAGVWGLYEDYYRTNVIGTRHVIEACRRHGIRRLIYTSSPSVVLGDKELQGVNESTPYPTRYLAHYPATKAEAERQVLAANSPELATVVLRPHLIWGPGDNHLVPRILARGRAGRLRRLGHRNPLIDTTYIDDAARAHVLAADRLQPGSAVAGKVYFISSGQPIPLWDMVNRILAAGGLPPVSRTLPVPIAYVLGAILETLYYLLGSTGEPLMTRFIAKELSTAHWFDLTAARRDLDYEPSISLDEGLKRLAKSLISAQNTDT